MANTQIRAGWLRVLIFAACGAALGFGQQGAAGRPEQPLTLDEAVKEAVARNLDLAAERFNVPIAQAQVLTAGLRPNPIFSF
jgi:hypothetical protein